MIDDRLSSLKPSSYPLGVVVDKPSSKGKDQDIGFKIRIAPNKIEPKQYKVKDDDDSAVAEKYDVKQKEVKEGPAVELEITSDSHLSKRDIEEIIQASKEQYLTPSASQSSEERSESYRSEELRDDEAREASEQHHNHHDQDEEVGDKEEEEEPSYHQEGAQFKDKEHSEALEDGYRDNSG